MKNNKNAWIFFIFVLILYVGTTFYFNYTKESTPVVTDLPDEERALCSLKELEGDRIELTVPPSYVYGASQEQLAAAAKQNGYEAIILNEDGSATYTMTRTQHEELLRGVGEGITAKLVQMCGSKNYRDIASIQPNEDFTDFTVHLSSLGENQDYSMATVTLKLYSTMYNAFRGIGKAPFHVLYINKEGQPAAETNPLTPDDADDSNAGASDSGSR